VTNTQGNTLVLKDQSGEYYLLQLETLDQCRVPAEHREELEQVLAGEDDVSGHLAFLAGMLVGVIIGSGATIGGYHLARYLEGPEAQVIDISQVL